VQFAAARGSEETSPLAVSVNGGSSRSLGDVGDLISGKEGLTPAR
jgi:hypothetical protein